MTARSRPICCALLLLLVCGMPLMAQGALPAQGILPRLDTVLIDGNLAEWAGVPPIRTGRMEHSSTPLQWKGAQDASMTILYSWQEEGIAVAGQVADADAVRNADPRNGDTLDLYFSGTTDPRVNMLSKGVFRVMMIPPTTGDDAEVTLVTPPLYGTDVKLMEFAAKRVPGGYAFELFLPWDFITDGTPEVGAVISVAQVLHDSDPGRVYPQLVSRGPDGSGSRVFTRLALTDTVDFARVTPEMLRLYSNLQAPSPCMTPTIPLTMEMAPQLLGAGRAVTLTLAKDGKACLTKSFAAAELTRAGGMLAVGNADLDAAGINDGDYRLTLTLSDAAHREMGAIAQPLILLAGVKSLVTDAVTKLAAVQFDTLAKTDPFKASAYFSVVAAVEWLKWGIEQKQTHAMLDASTEIRDRFAVLDGTGIADTDSMYALLTLTANPDAQFAAEYIRERTPQYPRQAAVSVNWGMFPLMMAYAREYATTREAEDATQKHVPAWCTSPLTIGAVTVSNVRQVKPTPVERDAVNPEQYALMLVAPRMAAAIPLGDLPGVTADAVCIFAGCPDTAASAVKRWAEAAQIPVVAPTEVKGYAAVLYAGTPDDSPAARPFKEAKWSEYRVSPKTGTLYFTRGRLAIMLPYVSLDAAKIFAGVILDGKPGTVAQADAIRQAIVKATGRMPAKRNLPAGMAVYVGDLHDHSFLSDGRPTPLTVTAEAIYCGLDFHVLSDHGVFFGAMKHRASMDKCQLNFACIPGVEMNSRWGHLNVYPVKTALPFGPTRADMVKAAHEQNAVIQWNHPQLEGDNVKEDFERGIAGTGLDAWEHLPPKYSQWKQAGTLPVLTGGTDSHDGTFAMPERTFLFAPSTSGSDIADAVRKGNVLLVDPWNGAYGITRELPMCYDWNDLYFYGSDRMIQLGVDVLADGAYLKELKKQRLTEALQHVDIKALIEASSAYETVK